MMSQKKFFDKMKEKEREKGTEEEKRKALVGLKVAMSVMTIITKYRLKMNPMRKRLKTMSQ